MVFGQNSHQALIFLYIIQSLSPEFSRDFKINFTSWLQQIQHGWHFRVENLKVAVGDLSA